MRRRTIELAITVAMASAALAQPQAPPPQGPPQGQYVGPMGQGQGRFNGPGAPGGTAGQRGPGGRGAGPDDSPATLGTRASRFLGGTWWRNPDMVQKLALNSEQQKKIEDIFQQHRLKLVDLDATLRKEEITMEPLMAADSPDEAKSLAQIDKVAQARAELEKANARFLFGIRRVLTPDQWKKLQDASRGDGAQGRGGPGGPGGPGPGGPGRGGREE